MKVVALISGGKDSCYNMLQCVSEGHTIVALANLYPVERDEIDSYMYQTVGHQAIELIAEAMDVPLFRRPILGKSVEQSMYYTTTKDDEVEDLFLLLCDVLEKLDVQAVSVGAILSDYQRVRVEHVCLRLGLTPLAFLWRRNQTELLEEMIAAGVHAIIIKVAALGLTPKEHLGKSLGQIKHHMEKMRKMYGLNVCGEGGEYETFTLDCPLFKKRIVLDSAETIVHSDDAFAPVAYMNLKDLHLQVKEECTTGMMVNNSLNELFTPEEIQTYVHSKKEAVEVVHEARKQGSRTSLADHPSHISAFQNQAGLVWITNVKPSIKCENVSLATKDMMEALKKKLHDLDLSLSCVVAVHLIVSDMSQFSSINSVYKGYFDINPPVRICIEANINDEFPVMLSCVASGSKIEKKTLHVQSVSRWAPANIGPYSQAIHVHLPDHPCIFVAGQIALWPSTMNIIEGGIFTESRLSVRHVQRIIAGIDKSCTLKNINGAVCYVVHKGLIRTSHETWDASFQAENVIPATHVQFVVVPALPRGALVEWQVTAMPGISSRSHYQCSRKNAHFEITTQFQISEQLDEGKKFINVVTCVHCTMETATISMLTNIWKEIFLLLNDKLLELNLSYSAVGCPVIFYTSQRVSCRNMSDAHSSSVSLVYPNLSSTHAPSFIPVTEVGADGALFSVSM